MFGNTYDKRILKIIKSDEKHDKSNVISSLEFLKILKKRYILMQDILKPLIDSLNKEMIITNIYFAIELDGNFSINISYVKDGISGLIIVYQSEENDIEFALCSQDKMLDNLVMDKKKIIIDIFNHGSYEYFDRKSEEINTTSGLFSVLPNNNYLRLSGNSNGDVPNQFKMTVDYSSLDLIGTYKILTEYSNVEEKFKDKKNVSDFLEHVKVYEKNVPYYLLRKK